MIDYAAIRKLIAFRVVTPSLLLMLIGTAIASANPIGSACANFVGAYDADIYRVKTAFDRKRQKGWYSRWWSGKCDDVPFPDFWTCIPDESKAWNKIVDNVVGESQGPNRTEAQKEICELGQLMGLEWAKDNGVRCIHTSDLKPLWQILRSSNIAPFDRISSVRKVAEAKMQDCH